MLIRVRSNVGVWRVDGLDEATATVEHVLQGIRQSRPQVSYEKPLSADPACNSPLDTTQTLAEQGLGHGSMVHCRVDPATCLDITTGAGADNDKPLETAQEAASAGRKVRRVIDKDGKIQLLHSDSGELGGADNGFRPGMLALRDMKMQWTLNDFIALDSQYEFKIQRQEASIAQRVSLDADSIGSFQNYLRVFNFSRVRVGYLYGKFVPSSSDEDDKDDSKQQQQQQVQVEAIYEPPQEVDTSAVEGFVLLEDPLEERVEQLAQLLGLRKVGWIFGHPQRTHTLTSAEILMAAEFQLEAAGGIEETPFCTVKVGQGEDGNVSVEAFQVSQQCMSMVAEEALEIDPTDLGLFQVNDTFTAIQEGKPSKTVDNNFFLTVVPIVQHTSELLVSQFPKFNRDLDDRTPSHDELKAQLSKSGTAGWTFVDLLADFSLLLYLSKFLDFETDLPKLCASVVDRDKVPLDDGYKLIIASMAGMDGSY